MSVEDFTITAKLTCPEVPVQFEGTVGEDRFYFRSRHGEWTFGACHDGDPVKVSMGLACGFRITGEHDEEFASIAECRKLLLGCIAELLEYGS
jgi:hypothetical protein